MKDHHHMEAWGVGVSVLWLLPRSDATCLGKSITIRTPFMPVGQRTGRASMCLANGILPIAILFARVRFNLRPSRNCCNVELYSTFYLTLNSTYAA